MNGEIKLMLDKLKALKKEIEKAADTADKSGQTP